jgi:hypothetical protein
MNANKISIVITLILIFAITVPLNLLPTNGQATVNNKEKTYPFIGANPNPVQIGQRVLLHYGISYALAGLGNGWTGITITVTKPDTTTETLTCGITDTTGGSSIWYTPTMVGNYTLETNFPEQKMPSTSAGIPINTTMLASKSEKMTLIVQEEPIEAWPGQPLPTEYWSRPINAQLYEWTTIGGDWLEHKAFFASTYAPFNSEAPETAHILWTRRRRRRNRISEFTGN